MRTALKLLFRLLAFPFVAVVILIAAIRNYFFTCWLWLSKGGELMTHDDVFNPTTMRENIKTLNALVESLKKNNHVIE